MTMSTGIKTRLSPTHLLQQQQNELFPSHLAFSSPLQPIKHWSQTCHETILSSTNPSDSIPLALTGGADNGQFIFFNETLSLLIHNVSLTIVKGGKIDREEILLEIDQHKIAGCTLADVRQLVETLSINGKQIKLKTVKSGLTKDLRQFLDARFQKGSIDHDLQQTIRDNLYMRTVPCTTRPPRPGEANGQDYTFLSIKDFRALEKSGNLLESGVYKGHYYGTPRPPKEPIINGHHHHHHLHPPPSSASAINLLRRSNSANEMFQQQQQQRNGAETGSHYQYPNNDPEFFNGHSPNETTNNHPMFHHSAVDSQASSTSSFNNNVHHQQQHSPYANGTGQTLASQQQQQQQHSQSRAMANGNRVPSPAHLSGELISCALQKSQGGFGFTIIGGNEKGEHFLQIKEILSDGPAARDGKLRRGDILVYVNDTNVLGFSHTDVVRIFQSLSIGEAIRLTVCRGYPLAVDFDDPQIDVVSLNGVHGSLSLLPHPSTSSVNHLPNGGYTEYQPEYHHRQSPQHHPCVLAVTIHKGDSGFGFTVADSPLGQRVKAIVDKPRCQELCENDLLLLINGQDLSGKTHSEVVDILIKCPKDADTVFAIRRGDSDLNNNNSVLLNGTTQNRFDKNNQENDQTDTRYPPPSSKFNEKPRSKTPTPFGSAPLADTLPLRSRTPLPSTTTTTLNRQTSGNNNNNTNNPYDNNLSFIVPNNGDTSTPIVDTELVPSNGPMNTFDRQTTWSRSARDVRTSTNGQTQMKTSSNTQVPLSRSKTPGPEFGSNTAYRQATASTLKQRSKTPTAADFPSYKNNMQRLENSRSLQSVHNQYYELVVNLTLLRPMDGFGLRIVGGEEEKSQVSVGRIVQNSPAHIDGRLREGDEIVKIDGHSTIRASHEKVVHLMQQAKENQRVSLIVRRYLNPINTNQFQSTEFDSRTAFPPYGISHSDSGGIRHVTLHKTNDNQSFGFVIISSQNKAGATVDADREESQQMRKMNMHKVWIGKIIPNSPADQCGQLHVNDRILAVNDVDLTHMLHTDVVSLIKESGRSITLKIGPPIQYDDRSQEFDTATTRQIPHSFATMNPNTTSNGMRPSSSSPMVIANGNHPHHQPPPTQHLPQPTTNGNHTLRNAFSHNPLNMPERNPNRPSSRANGVLKPASDDYFTVDLQRPFPNSSFGFSIRGGREFSIPLYILKLAENGPAARDGRMRSGDQIIEINGRSTYGMNHSEAISLIREGGLYVRLLLRKTNAPPPSLDGKKVKTAMVGPMVNGAEYHPSSSHWQPSGYT